MPLALTNINIQTIRDFDSYFAQDLAQSHSALLPDGGSLNPAPANDVSSWCESPTISLVNRAVAEVPALLNAPGKHLFLVNDPSKRRENERAHSILFTGSMPPGAFRRISSSLCVPSAELCFVQYAACHSLVESVVFGFELCGRYRIDPTNEEGMRKAKPLTTPERIIKFASNLHGVSGKRKALRAARHLIPNSKSPTESTSAILLCLPKRIGGHALPHPLLNYVFPELDGLYCDALWLDIRLALEYESYRWHTGRRRIVNDSKRRAALMSKNIDVITLTYDQLTDVNAFNLVASEIARRLGIRSRSNEPNRIHEQMALRGELAKLGCL